ncbi:hypothetical protein Q8A67_020246 [Cirrhinus molitorella]|uniref:Uncharacterized protein n=1 Tax=Cirrhinus molitorella TaxID=172907 RepID=A0AA88P9Y9_9TELE|nr:hypothetical protein Q8A67_020246 [Cirrhinus molitorella]
MTNRTATCTALQTLQKIKLKIFFSITRAVAYGRNSGTNSRCPNITCFPTGPRFNLETEKRSEDTKI